MYTNNPFESDAEASSSTLQKKKSVKPRSKSVVSPKTTATKKKRLEKELLDSDSEGDVNISTGCKKRKTNVFPDSEDEEIEPIRATPLKSFLSRRTGSGYTYQSNPSKRGEYYIEVRISSFKELESLKNDRWQHSLVSFKTAVDDNSTSWKALNQLVTAVKDEFRNIQPVLYPAKS